MLISANAEWQAVQQILKFDQTLEVSLGECMQIQLEEFKLIFFHGGWGKVSAAATTQFAIDHFLPELLINLGTCGGFEGVIETGQVILAARTIIYDIQEQMTDPDEAIAHYSTELDLSWLPRVVPSPVLRGMLVSADRDLLKEDIPMLISKYDAVAADWESGAIAWVAKRNHTKCLILRGVTDLVGPEGGEAYGDFELYQRRTKEMMRTLIDQLPAWLRAIEKAGRGGTARP